MWLKQRKNVNETRNAQKLTQTEHAETGNVGFFIFIDSFIIKIHDTLILN